MTETCDAMFLAAHPDDAEICCAGTMLMLIASGRRVAIVDMSAGELGTNGTPETRRAECEAATRKLGAQIRGNLQLPDGGISNDEDSLAAVVAEIRRLKPAVFFAPHPKDVHPDHVATGQVAHRAFFHSGLAKFRPDLGAPFRPRQLIQYQGNDHIEANFCVDISEYADKKLEVIECYSSQVHLADSAHSAKKLDPLQRVATRDQYYGAQVGRRAAEPFATRGLLMLSGLDGVFEA